jgi:hypothetical protein
MQITKYNWLNIVRRSQWPRGVMHEMSSPARTLGSWVRIPLQAWMLFCIYSDPPSKESYQLSIRLRNWSETKRFTDALCCKWEQREQKLSKLILRIFWVTATYSLVCDYKGFEGMCCLCFQGRHSISLVNPGNHLPNCRESLNSHFIRV